ncbi:ankyrin repeat domain-containing protein [Flammeovirga agarivorans]|uniref:Ankyrin repeat domain-containing protein n=1 Tax=Flammeovirga agarivorans TaxID=2726742 RepID=A0A7X8SJT8_9BACT|nr:ankyrin repeat domain-containing protein [Flammeovirga agarivorans]NLR91433.1 ankyrin repeat domain-containing protein [Flammeovirga agarivorans]
MKSQQIINLLILLGFIVSINNTSAQNRQDEHLTPLMKAAGEGNVELVEELINNGENIFVIDPITGTNVVHFAAQGGHVEVMKILVEHGAEAIINLQAASNTFTPLMVATWYQNPKMIQYLLSLDHINANLKDQYGRTAAQFPVPDKGSKELHPIDQEISEIFAKYYKKYDRYMEQHFEDKVTPKNLPKDVNLVIPNNEMGNGYHTAALVASRNNNIELFRKMIENGADLTLEGEYMKAVVTHKAAYMGNSKIMHMIVKHKDFDKIKNAQGPTNGYTPLHDAIWHGNTATAKILLDAGVDTSIVAWDGLTPLDLAKKKGYQDIVDLFQ